MFASTIEREENLGLPTFFITDEDSNFSECELNSHFDLVQLYY